MSDWTIPGDHTVADNYGADLDLSSSHQDFKGERYTATLEMRNSGTGEWLGPKVEVVIDNEGTTITDFNGAELKFPAITFAHVGVQGLLDRSKIVAFVSAKLPDPR